MENFHNRNFLSYENFLFFPNFAQPFHHDAIGFKENFQHESCSPPQNIQLWFTKFSQKMLGSQVMILWTRVHETFNLVKFCPSLGRILTYLHGNVSHSSKWNLKIHFKYGLYIMLEAFQNVWELSKIVCG